MAQDTPKAILLISSDIDLHAILADRLLPHGYTIVTADHADSAEQFGRFPGVTAVLLDLDGTVVPLPALLRGLQQYCPHTPLIALSIRAQLGKVALQYGASQYLPKPLDLPMLILALPQRDR